MRTLFFRLVCLGLALFGLAPQAQTIVRLDPIIPIANLPARAIVTFSGTNPTSATVFVRPVGTTAFQSLTAIDEGNNEWGVALPFDMPPQGLEVYAEYVLDGETITEPDQSPELFPYRVPSLNRTAQSGTSLPARQYRMVTIPFYLDQFAGLPFALGSSAPIDVFGDDFGQEGDPTQWRVLRWNALLNRYRDAIADSEVIDPVIRPGRGFWIITANGGTFDVERGLSTGVSIDGDRAFITTESVTVQTGWNQIGNPFLVPVQWADVVGSGLVEDPIGYRGTYTTPQATLQPWEGYFVFNPGDAVTLRFSARPPDSPDRRGQSLAQTMRDRAGDGASVLSVTAESGALSDEVYLGLADRTRSTDRPLNLHKPPPVEDGLRLAVKEAGEDWIGRFHSVKEARWTLALTLPSAETVTLRLKAEGDWPQGLVIEDLDRDVELAIVGGTVSVPNLGGTPTRRLQIRTADASSTPAAVALGAPWPNPAAATVSVPYTLAASGPTRLEVLDALGRTVRVIHEGEQDAGPHTLLWDGLNASDQPVAAGVYLIRLHAGGHTATARVTRLR